MVDTLDNICKNLELPPQLANFQDTYNPIHIYCRLKELSEYDFHHELKQYEELYNSIILKIKLSYKK